MFSGCGDVVVEHAFEAAGSTGSSGGGICPDTTPPVTSAGNSFEDISSVSAGGAVVVLAEAGDKRDTPPVRPGSLRGTVAAGTGSEEGSPIGLVPF
jgi:hypothetical protein